jgi:hypothetical protein
MTMAAFKDSQKGGAGPYTGNTTVGREIKTEDTSTNPKAKCEKPESIAEDLGVDDGCSGPIVSSTGGYKPVTRGGGRRYEPL